VIVIQLLDRWGQVLAEGQPDPDGHITLHGDPSRPTAGGYPRLRIIQHQEVKQWP
jgi:hypothetical protein